MLEISEVPNIWINLIKIREVRVQNHTESDRNTKPEIMLSLPQYYIYFLIYLLYILPLVIKAKNCEQVLFH